MVTLKRFRRIGILALLGVAAVAGGQRAYAGPAWSLDTPQNFRNGSWSFGEIFTVGGSSISVTAIGAFDANLDGFVTQSGIPVGIFRESDGALLASTTVLSSDPLTGHYRYDAISPLTLLANTDYRVVAVNEGDLYNINSPTPNSVDPLITWDGYGYCNTTALTSCDTFTGNNIAWMANFIIDGSSVSVPEPGTFALFGAALAGLGFARRRKQ
jgi:hypothetical protein